MNKLFKIEKRIFPILVDYNLIVYKAWEEALKRVVSWGNIEMDKMSFSNTGICKFNCYFATLQEKEDLWEKEKIFFESNIIPADAMQLFSFIISHPINDILIERNIAIVAGAKGSTWKCSHEINHEMVGVAPNTYYRNPGPCLHTESGPFKKGTVFLSIK